MPGADLLAKKIKKNDKCQRNCWSQGKIGFQNKENVEAFYHPQISQQNIYNGGGRKEKQKKTKKTQDLRRKTHTKNSLRFLLFFGAQAVHKIHFVVIQM